MGKKFKATPFTKYHDLFPAIEEAETLGSGAVRRKFEARDTSKMAAKAVISLGGKPPEWLQEALGLKPETT